MKAAGLSTSIHAITAAYREKLQTITPATFNLSPAAGGWSYSEVYAHIFDLSILSLDAIDRCLSPDAKPRTTPMITRAILFFGAFPPAIKFKVPKQFESRVKKISMAEATQLMDAFELKLAQHAEKVNQANPLLKTAHPRLGYLNALQWLRFTEIHLKHHLKQLNRIARQDNFTSLRP